MTIARIALGLALAFVSATAFAADAPPGPVRKVLQSFPASGAPGEQINITEASFAPGAVLGYHTHPGEEAGVVVEGAVIIQIEGQAPTTYTVGQSFLIPRGAVHKASAQIQTRVIGTYVVDKDKPLVIPKP